MHIGTLPLGQFALFGVRCDSLKRVTGRSLGRPSANSAGSVESGALSMPAERGFPRVRTVRLLPSTLYRDLRTVDLSGICGFSSGEPVDLGDFWNFSSGEPVDLADFWNLRFQRAVDLRG